MRKVSLFIVCLIFSQVAICQKIKGTVTDEDGKPLAFASVFVKGKPTGTHTNHEGRFTLQLSPGTHTLVCQHIGYERMEKEVKMMGEDIEVNFALSLQTLILDEVVLNRQEDAAYEIIRNTIRQKEKHQQEWESFRCEVYTKGQLQLRDYPDKLFGQKVEFDDGDSSRRKMLFLSETISTYAVSGEKKEKIEVLSSRVSGQQDGFGLSAPRFYSFYRDNISIGENLNPRGFISPVAENALNYYRYKFEGSYFEDGREIAHIRVTPKRKYEPLFGGFIDIVVDEWRIHSLKLELTKSSQLELVDTIRLEQLYRPQGNGHWFISSQVIYPAIKMFGFDAFGSFVNIYSRVDLSPAFAKKEFGNTILKYTDSASKKTVDYWEQNRPVPLLEEEEKDYHRKDSLEILRRDPRYMDSLDRKRNRFSPAGFVLLGQSFVNTRKRHSFTIPSLLDMVNFNPAEGLVLHPTLIFTKRLDSNAVSRKSVTITPGLRYGFANRHFNPHLTVNYNFGKKLAGGISVSGGSRVFQFNPNSPITERSNTFSTLLEKDNRFKSYEARYFEAGFRQGLGDGLSWSAGIQYQDRRALDNVTEYSWRNKTSQTYTPNYPWEIMNRNIDPHQALQFSLSLRWRPGTRYVELPGRKISIGSKYPVFTVEYIQGLPDVLGSDVKFSKWRFRVSDGINLKLAGKFNYRVGVGGFFNRDSVPVPDYNHFNGNISVLATEYLNSFQLLPIYRFSNTARLYSLAHIEYNLNGFLTNKIPGFRRLNFYLVTGTNAFYIDKRRNYIEWFVGLENILKRIRVDFVQGYTAGVANHSAVRIGLRR